MKRFVITLALGLATCGSAETPVTNVSMLQQVGFDKLLRSMGKVGFTFGGGCFFGHGVSVSGAMFYMTCFVIDPAERPIRAL